MNNKYTFGVITKVPSCSEVGNTSSVLLTRDFKVEKETEELGFSTSRSYRALEDKELEDGFDLKHEDLAWVLLPVFELGEILILDSPYGREVKIGRAHV